MSDEIVDAMTPKLLGNYPNTYTFTKGLAEHIVTNEGGDMPVVIVRPSIIIGSYAEPFPVSIVISIMFIAMAICCILLGNFEKLNLHLFSMKLKL